MKLLQQNFCLGREKMVGWIFHYFNCIILVSVLRIVYHAIKFIDKLRLDLANKMSDFQLWWLFDVHWDERILNHSSKLLRNSDLLWRMRKYSYPVELKFCFCLGEEEWESFAPTPPTLKILWSGSVGSPLLIFNFF